LLTTIAYRPAGSAALADATKPANVTATSPATDFRVMAPLPGRIAVTIG
jgi:hypothetical protein